MPVKLNLEAFDHAKDLIEKNRLVADEKDAWREHRPAAAQEDEFIRKYGLAEYAKWHLGVDDAEPEDYKGRYKFPYGDYRDLHRCGVLAVEAKAQEAEYYEIEVAAADLHAIIDGREIPAKSPLPPTGPG